MNDNQLSEKLSEIFRSVFKNSRAPVTPQTTAQDIPGWDSLTHIHLILGIESGFGIRFRHSEVAGFSNVGDMMDAIRRHMAA